MGDVAVVTMPEQLAGSISEWSKDQARLHMLEEALSQAVEDFGGICEERMGNLPGYVDRLRAGLRKVEVLVDEVAKFDEDEL